MGHLASVCLAVLKSAQAFSLPRVFSRFAPSRRLLWKNARDNDRYPPAFWENAGEKPDGLVSRAFFSRTLRPVCHVLGTKEAPPGSAEPLSECLRIGLLALLVGVVEAGALKHDSRGLEHALSLVAALGAVHLWMGAHGMLDLEGGTA